MKDYIKILEIEETLTEANEHYAVTGEDFLIEEEYNMLMRKLQELDPTNPLIHTPQAVIVKSDEKVIHETPMLSLEKVYSIADLKKWMRKVARDNDENFIIMPKLDGIAGRLEEGVLSTRGDGVNGENISHRLPLIDYRKENYNGELVITDGNFDRIVEYKLMTRKDGSTYKNSRNAISGIMNSEYDFHWTESWKPVEFIGYEDINVITTLGDIEKHIETIREGSSDIPTDGFVVKVADDEYAESLGYTSHHYKHSIALKEASNTIETTLLDVEFQQARSHIGMVGILEPVELGGVTISRVSLHNMDIVNNLELCVGDKVEIKRAGEVIPHIVKVVEKSKDRVEIACHECPACGGDVELEGQFWKCQNKTCGGQAINQIVSSASKLGIKGIAKGTITKLCDANYIFSIVDLLNLDRNDELLNVFKVGSKSYENFFKELERIKSVDMPDYLIFGAWGIDGFGRNFYKKIFKSIRYNEFVALCTMGDKSALIHLPTISEIRAEKLIEAFKDTEILDGLKKCFKIKQTFKPVPYDYEVAMEETEIKENKEMKGTICFTGKGFTGRKELTELAEDAGYEVVSSVTKSLGTLVCEDPGKGSSKLKKAASYGVSVISYNEFQGMV